MGQCVPCRAEVWPHPAPGSLSSLLREIKLSRACGALLAARSHPAGTESGQRPARLGHCKGPLVGARGFSLGPEDFQEQV